MVVSIKHLGEKRFEAIGNNKTFEIIPKEVSPLELFLLGMISCSGVDMVVIPQKKGFEIQDLLITCEGVISEGVPYRFVGFHITYNFKSSTEDFDLPKKWVLSSLQSYCSTINTIRGVASVYYSIVYNNQNIIEKAKIDSGEKWEKELDFANLNNGACCTKGVLWVDIF